MALLVCRVFFAAPNSQTSPISANEGSLYISTETIKTLTFQYQLTMEDSTSRGFLVQKYPAYLEFLVYF